MDNRHCKDCLYCVKGCEYHSGFCHKRSPGMQPDPITKVMFAVWPRVDTEYDWCGNFEAVPPRNEEDYGL